MTTPASDERWEASAEQAEAVLRYVHGPRWREQRTADAAVMLCRAMRHGLTETLGPEVERLRAEIARLTEHLKCNIAALAGLNDTRDEVVKLRASLTAEVARREAVERERDEALKRLHYYDADRAARVTRPKEG
jgi:hypothetical protein